MSKKRAKRKKSVGKVGGFQKSITIIDMAAMLVSIVVLWLFSFTKFKVERWEGAVLTLGYAAYLAWLLHEV